MRLRSGDARDLAEAMIIAIDIQSVLYLNTILQLKGVIYDRFRVQHIKVHGVKARASSGYQSSLCARPTVTSPWLTVPGVSVTDIEQHRESLTNDVDTLEEHVSKDVEVHVAATLDAAESETVAGIAEPEVDSVQSVQLVAHGERNLWQLSVGRVLPATLLFVEGRAIDGI